MPSSIPPDGGVITVDSKFTMHEALGPVVEVAVVDTGIGIDPEHQERIFDKFFRVDDTDHHSTGKTKFKGAGPGLGLTLVKRDCRSPRWVGVGRESGPG